MTVAELINQLQQFRPDARVEIEYIEEYFGNTYNIHEDIVQVVMYNDTPTSDPTVTIVAGDEE